MKKNRNLFYTNNQTGGFFNPNANNNMMVPSGFNQNSNYMAYGPGIGPNGVIAPIENANIGYIDEETIENRLSKIERQIRKIETRLSKLESSSELVIDDNVNNMYMI